MDKKTSSIDWHTVFVLLAHGQAPIAPAQWEQTLADLDISEADGDAEIELIADSQHKGLEFSHGNQSTLFWDIEQAVRATLTTALGIELEDTQWRRLLLHWASDVYVHFVVSDVQLRICSTADDDLYLQAVIKKKGDRDERLLAIDFVALIRQLARLV